MSGRSYDIITPANMEDVEVNSWFDVKQGEPCPTTPFALLASGETPQPSSWQECDGNALVAGDVPCGGQLYIGSIVHSKFMPEVCGINVVADASVLAAGELLLRQTAGHRAFCTHKPLSTDFQGMSTVLDLCALAAGDLPSGDRLNVGFSAHARPRHRTPGHKLGG